MKILIVGADYRFIPGVNVKDCMQLVTAIHGINPFQQMPIMTALCCGKPFRVEQLLAIAAAARVAALIRIVQRHRVWYYHYHCGLRARG